jgi:transposase-like protein
VSAFCRRYGLAEKYLYRWRRILAERDAEQAAFVPVRLLTENASQALRSAVRESGADPENLRTRRLARLAAHVVGKN